MLRVIMNLNTLVNLVIYLYTTQKLIIKMKMENGSTCMEKMIWNLCF